MMKHRPSSLLPLGALLLACAPPPSLLPGSGTPEPLLLRGEIRGMVAADPDGDGRDSLFLLFPTGLMELSMGTSPPSLTRSFHRLGTEWVQVSAGDINGDGRDELALNGLQPQVVSVLLRASPDGSLKPTSAASPLYLRITLLPSSSGPPSPGLGCQRPASEEAYQAPALLCTVDEEGRIRPQDPLPLPNGVVLDDFFILPQQEAPALYTWEGDGRLTRRHGRQTLWRSDSRWMTRPISVSRTFSSLMGETSSRIQAFAPSPLIVDGDGDGALEAWVPTADDAGFTVLARVRVFKGGSFRTLVPEGYGLTLKRTGPLQGQAMISLALFDVTGDGQPEVLGASLVRPRGHPGGARTSLQGYDPKTGKPVWNGVSAPLSADELPLPPPATPLPIP